MGTFDQEPIKADKLPLSFAELSEMERVEADDFMAALLSYAQGGWAINPEVVIGVMRKIELDDEYLCSVVDLAALGIQTQEQNGTAASAGTVIAEQDKYVRVIEHAQDRLEELDSSAIYTFPAGA